MVASLLSPYNLIVVTFFLCASVDCDPHALSSGSFHIWCEVMTFIKGIGRYMSFVSLIGPELHKQHILLSHKHFPFQYLCHELPWKGLKTLHKYTVIMLLRLHFRLSEITDFHISILSFSLSFWAGCALWSRHIFINSRILGWNRWMSEINPNMELLSKRCHQEYA